MKILSVLLFSLVFIGCGQTELMESRLPDGTVLSVTDNKGNKYIIKHHMNGTYLVLPEE